jgi:Cu/Ag efflux protein CusF
MKTKSLFLAVLFSAVAVLPAFAQDAAKKEESKQGAEKKYHIDGTVKSVSLSARSAVIDAKAIPGFMAAMAMPYTFKDSVTLAKLKPGDHITGDLVVVGNKTLVDNVVVEKAVAKKDTTKKD